jgi:hypothetical protein
MKKQKAIFPDRQVDGVGSDLGSARASRAGFGASPKRTFIGVMGREKVCESHGIPGRKGEG